MKKLILKNKNQHKDEIVFNRKHTETKQDLYEARLLDKNHMERMFVEKNFFQTDKPLSEFRNLMKKYNAFVEKKTNSIEYSVNIRYGIPKIAADFKFQYERFVSYIKDNGSHDESMKVLEKLDVVWLSRQITWKESTGKFSLKKTIFEETRELSCGAKLLLILYKAYSSEPNRQPYMYYVQGGVTGLSDGKAAILINCTRKTISTYRKELQKAGFICERYFDGRFRKIAINI